MIELIAQRFRVLGEPMRIKLLDRLRDGEATVGELQEALGASQQNVSKHLGILHSAGMIVGEPRATSAVYSISDPGVFDLMPTRSAAGSGDSCARSTRCCRPAERPGAGGPRARRFLARFARLPGPQRPAVVNGGPVCRQRRASGPPAGSMGYALSSRLARGTLAPLSAWEDQDAVRAFVTGRAAEACVVTSAMSRFIMCLKPIGEVLGDCF